MEKYISANNLTKAIGYLLFGNSLKAMDGFTFLVSRASHFVIFANLFFVISHFISFHLSEHPRNHTEFYQLYEQNTSKRIARFRDRVYFYL